MSPAAVAAPPRDRPMSPGAYLAKRRAAAGFTVGEVAVALALADHVSFVDNPATSRRVVAALRAWLEDIEADRTGRGVALVPRLHEVFRFDEETYDMLVAAHEDPDAPPPAFDICRRCACTFVDPCERPGYGVCVWHEVPAGEAPLCNHCQLDGPANDA